MHLIRIKGIVIRTSNFISGPNKLTVIIVILAVNTLR